VSERLAPFLPGPLPELLEGEAEAVRSNAWAGRSTPEAVFRLEPPGSRPTSIGKVRAFHGNFGMHLRAYAYIRANGEEGLRTVSDDAVLAANYLRVRLRDAYDLPYDRICKHEVVFSGRRQKRESGVSTLDLAKAILDFGIHPPTIYFPLIVEEALMIEPTETESLETLDRFVAIMHELAERARSDPDSLRAAPRTTPVGRLDEATAARQPDLRWQSGSVVDRTAEPVGA
jgi:glycine dehydrogenase subunit 2